MLPLAILAGGLATRLRPISEKIPKSLIEVAGKPFIFHQLEYLRGQGIKNVVICTGYLGHMIKKVVGNGATWDMKISYSDDGPDPLGTGGAIKHALPLLEESFFVLYGDSYLPINFASVQKTFITSNKIGLMTILKNQNHWDKSNVEFVGETIIEYNKLQLRPQMKYIDYGLCILHSSALIKYPNKQAFDLSLVYNRLSLSRELIGYEVFDRFYEIGSPQGILDAQNYLLQKTSRIDL